MQVNKIETNDLKNEFHLEQKGFRIFEGSYQEVLFFLLRKREELAGEEQFKIDTQIYLYFGFYPGIQKALA
jgi:hypothetical protein